MTEHEQSPPRVPSVPDAAVAALRDALGGRPVAGAMVLGSGLGVLLEAWETERVLAAETIPGYPRSTVPGHAGRVGIVRWGEARGLVFQGRVHFYEGHDRPAVTFAVRLAAALGARWMLLTNAAGSADPRIAPGNVMVVEDHIRLFAGRRSGTGAVPGPARCGTPYSARMAEEAFRVLGEEGLRTLRGVLQGCPGPAYETAAEIEMMRRLGASAACMSTVIEVEEAWRLGMEVAALSLITNWATGLSPHALDHAEVVEMAGRVAPFMGRALDRLARLWTGESAGRA
jgi:purine-nucleoside phosphorylase